MLKAIAVIASGVELLSTGSRVQHDAGTMPARAL